MPSPMDTAVSTYIKLRNQRDEIKKLQKEAIAPLLRAMERMDAWFLKELSRQGANSVNTNSGTVFTKKRVSVTVRDWDAFIEFVLDNNELGLLEQRASKSAVAEFLESSGELPPGVHVISERVTQVRS